MTTSRPGRSRPAPPTPDASRPWTHPTPATTPGTPRTRPTPATTPGTPPTPPTRATTAETAPPPDALALTLDPVELDGFLAERWEREPLLVSRDEPGRFDGILSAADVGRLVGATGLRVPAFRLVRDGAPLPAASYTNDIPWRPSSFSGIADVVRVAEEHARGATIVLQALHLHWPGAAVYCRE